MLNYITQFEGVQTMVVFAFMVITGIFGIGYNVRRGMLVSDTEKQHDHDRAIEMKNIDRLRLVEVPKKSSANPEWISGE